MCYISVRKERHSYAIIERCREFVINLTTEELARATDWCGVRSGRDYDKFKEMGLTIGQASIVKAPIINEAPINIECKVKDIIPLGTHDMFIAEVVNVIADEKYLNKETGKFELENAKPLVYCHGQYYGLGEKRGKFGWSVEKKKKKGGLLGVKFFSSQNEKLRKQKRIQANNLPPVTEIRSDFIRQHL